MTTNILKDLKNKNEREKIFRKLEKSERIILKKLIEKLGESFESDEENADFNVKY